MGAINPNPIADLIEHEHRQAHRGRVRDGRAPMSARLRVRKSRAPLARPWRVRYGRVTIATFHTGAEALAFLRRLLAVAH